MGAWKQLTEKWAQLREKLSPAVQKTGHGLKVAGKSMGIIAGYMYKLRSVILAAPVAAAAAVLAVTNMSRLPAVVEITRVTLDTQSQDSLFGCLVIGVDYISREVAVLLPLILTVGCLLLTLCSKRVFYPWIISVFTLILPLFLLLSNMYPA